MIAAGTRVGLKNRPPASCKRELANMARSLAGGVTADADWQIAASAERREVEAALNAVLTERKEQRPKR
jgi:hypothetical protein